MNYGKSYTAEELKEMVSPDAIELVKKAKAEGKTFPKYYVSTGKKDGPERAKAFAAFLEENGISVTTNFEKDYGHEWRCWEENIEEFLDWLPRTDAYAGQCVRSDLDNEGPVAREDGSRPFLLLG